MLLRSCVVSFTLCLGGKLGHVLFTNGKTSLYSRPNFQFQVKGQYKVSNEALQGLYARVKHVLTTFQDFQIEHVLRSA